MRNPKLICKTISNVLYILGNTGLLWISCRPTSFANVFAKTSFQNFWTSAHDSEPDITHHDKNCDWVIQNPWVPWKCQNLRSMVLTKQTYHTKSTRLSIQHECFRQIHTIYKHLVLSHTGKTILIQNIYNTSTLEIMDNTDDHKKKRKESLVQI